MNVNVVIICFKYPPEYSGYGKQLKSVINKILEIECGFKFKILTAYDTSVKEAKKNLDIIPLSSNVIKQTGLLFYLFCIKVFFWLIFNRNKYDIIHCVKAGPEAVVSNIVSKIFNKKLIVKITQYEMSDREINNAKGIKKLIRKVKHYLLRDVDNYIAISEEIKLSLKERISSKSNIISIPNGVDIDNKFIPVNYDTKIKLREHLNLPKNDVIILFAGAINKRKGIYDLLISIKNVKVCNDFTLVICGPILEDFNFQKLIDNVNNTRNKIRVIYKGRVNNVEQYMQAADIFVLPSYSEGLPNVLLEAGATGLALIATDIGGNRDIVENSINGRLIIPGQIEMLANVLSELVDKKEVRKSYGQMARKTIESKFSLQKVACTYIDLYKKLKLYI